MLLCKKIITFASNKRTIMTKIGLLSDTHGYWDDRYATHFASCDEIWHAGDIGGEEILDKLEAVKPVRAVYGNMDGQPLRSDLAETLRFRVEEVDVMLTHIGGYPGHYAPSALKKIQKDTPRLFVCGHSHILKVVYDKTYDMLCVNPGAAGKQGFHMQRTLLRFDIDGTEVKNMEVIELV